MSKPNPKRKKNPKRSKGIHGGGGRTHLTPVQKILLGGGRYAAFKEIGWEENPE